ncbi:MAG: hypothetical protein U5J82_09415 [Desulfobacterales bacterium]|nr:hypothetical protein [Desulfobacterales bacterium]
MLLALASAYGIGRYFPVSTELISAVSRPTMPVVWGHAEYSMVSTGIGLLPCYFLAALHLLCPRRRSACLQVEAAKWSFCYLLILSDFNLHGWLQLYDVCCWVSVSALVLVKWSGKKARLVLFSFPVHFLGLGVAYRLTPFTSESTI